MAPEPAAACQIFGVDVAVQSNVTVQAYGTYQFRRSFLDGTNPNLQPATYRLVAKVYYGGAWVELAPHLPFTILSRSNNCGGPVKDPLITGLANTTQPVRWFYIMNQKTGGWYIVSPTDEWVMFLDKVDLNTSFGVFWKPVNNASFPPYYPDAGKNFSYVNISSDGRTIYFGSAIGSAKDIHVAALANTTQPVRWFYIMNESTGAWYIVSPTGEQVMKLDRVDQNTSFGIYWKPINKSFFQSYSDALQNYTYVNISSDGRTIYFGPL